MKTNSVPALIMLVAGLVDSIISIYLRLPLARFTRNLLIVLVIFYILGCVVKMVLDSIFKEEEPEQTDETQQEEIEKEQTKETDQADGQAEPEEKDNNIENRTDGDETEKESVQKNETKTEEDTSSGQKE